MPPSQLHPDPQNVAQAVQIANGTVRSVFLCCSCPLSLDNLPCEKPLLAVCRESSASIEAVENPLLICLISACPFFSGRPKETKESHSTSHLPNAHGTLHMAKTGFWFPRFLPHYSLLITHYSLLITHYSLLIIISPIVHNAPTSRCCG